MEYSDRSPRLAKSTSDDSAIWITNHLELFLEHIFLSKSQIRLNYNMILFYLLLVVSRAIPNSIPRRVSAWKVILVFFWMEVIRTSTMEVSWLFFMLKSLSNFRDQRVSSLLATSRRHMMQLLKANICRAAVCDKCQKMALQGGSPSRPRLVSVKIG